MTTQLRLDLEQAQRTEGEVAFLFDGLYKFQAEVIDRHFPDAGRVDWHPLIGIVPDINKLSRGYYLSVGPLGWPHWISLNPLAFPTAADACETLVHELAHWYCTVCGWDEGHGRLWQASLAKCGVLANDTGKHYGYASEWYELQALALELELDTVLLS